MDKKGAKVYLAQRVRVPPWLRHNERVSVSFEKRGERRVRVLAIRGGEAVFMPGGQVDVVVPPKRSLVIAFEPLQVLQITDASGKVLGTNYYLCPDCFANTGKKINHRPSDVHGKEDATFRCEKCGKEWERKAI